MNNEPKMPLSHVMTRAQFLRTIGRGALGLIATGAIGTYATVAAQSNIGEAVVFPTGQYPNDVLEVSAAVNGGFGPSGKSYPGGGVVLLKATDANGTPMFFNFGSDGSVKVMKDVTVIGESMAPTALAFPDDPAPTSNYTPDRTVIYGGKRSFGFPNTAPAPVKFVAKNLYFAYPTIAAVLAAMSAGMEVTDCVIYGAKPGDTGIGFFSAAGINVFGGLTPGSAKLFGDFRIMNNRIRRVSLASVAPTSVEIGIVMSESTMNALIVGNEIEGFAFAGIGVDRNVGPVTIAENRVTNCGHGGTAFADALSGAIAFRGTTTPATIERNSMTGGYAGTSGTFLSRTAIVLAASNVVVHSNTVRGSFALEPILLATYTVSGRSWSATDNRIERNDLAQSTGAEAQARLYQGSDRNRFSNNDYGSISATGIAGMVVESSSNTFVNEDFWGTYSGKPAQPCMLFTPTSSANTVSAFKYQGAPQGFDVCNQVLDQGSNFVHGSRRCK